MSKQSNQINITEEIKLNTKVLCNNIIGKVTGIENKRVFVDFETGLTACPTFDTFKKHYTVIEQTVKGTSDSIVTNISLIDKLLKNTKHEIKERWLYVNDRKVLIILSDGIAVKEDIATKCNLQFTLCKYNHGYRAKIHPINEAILNKVLKMA